MGSRIGLTEVGLRVCEEIRVSALTTKVMDFDPDDVERLDQAIKKFWDLRRSRGYPDWSDGAGLYSPILSFVLLRAQERLERLTQALVVLSLVLAALTVALVTT